MALIIIGLVVGLALFFWMERNKKVIAQQQQDAIESTPVGRAIMELQKGAELGAKHYRVSGPVDNRTCDCCKASIENQKPRLIKNGLAVLRSGSNAKQSNVAPHHDGCRCWNHIVFEA